MDQWQGWYGQPGVTYDKTIQYEVGFDVNFADVWRVSSAFYYKDGSQLNRFNHTSSYNRGGGGVNAIGWGVASFRDNYSRSRNIAGDGHDNIFYTNNGYKDTRGIEVSLDKLYANNWSATVNYNYSLSSGGLAGYAWYYEDASRANTPHPYDEIKDVWDKFSPWKEEPTELGISPGEARAMFGDDDLAAAMAGKSRAEAEELVKQLEATRLRKQKRKEEEGKEKQRRTKESKGRQSRAGQRKAKQGREKQSKAEESRIKEQLEFF